MGLTISLGGFTRMRGIDDPWVRLLQTQLEIANELLAKHGLAPYQESEDPVRLDNRSPKNNFGYDAIHFLRRAYARHLMYGEIPVQPVPTEQSIWFCLYEAARLSIQHGILVWFGRTGCS